LKTPFFPKGPPCSRQRFVVLLLLGVLPVGLAARPADKPRFRAAADFTKCIDRYEAAPEVCLEALAVLVKANPAQAFAAGKAVRAKLTHSAAVPFFAKAFAKADKAAPDHVRCADADVAMALVSGLELPAKGGTTVADALAILFERCWAETQAPVLKALSDAGPSGYLAENLCPRLLERKVTNPSCDRKPSAAVTPVEPKWKDIDPKIMAVDGAAKVLRGAEGRTVALVKLKSDDAYLVRFDGFRGAWNGRVLLHRETPVNSGYDYFTPVNGSRWVSVVVRDGVTEVYPSGDKGPFTVSYDDASSKTASAQAILDQFRKQKP
jgi:hypothetical protein